MAVIDVASGRIEALAGALSPCARQEVDGPGRDAHCDRRLPYPVRYRPDALLNPAVYHDAMPASTIKPIMGAAFLSDREVGARWLAAERAAMQRHAEPAPDSLRGQLMRSDSARFLDRMFCLDKGFANCRRPWEIQSAALAFGWNIGCAEARADCGKQDLLFGRAVDATADPGANCAPATTVAYGRLMSDLLGDPRRALGYSRVSRELTKSQEIKRFAATLNTANPRLGVHHGPSGTPDPGKPSPGSATSVPSVTNSAAFVTQADLGHGHL